MAKKFTRKYIKTYSLSLAWLLFFCNYQGIQFDFIKKNVLFCFVYYNSKYIKKYRVLNPRIVPENAQRVTGHPLLKNI